MPLAHTSCGSAKFTGQSEAGGAIVVYNINTCCLKCLKGMFNLLNDYYDKTYKKFTRYTLHKCWMGR